MLDSFADFLDFDGIVSEELLLVGVVFHGRAFHCAVLVTDASELVGVLQTFLSVESMLKRRRARLQYRHNRNISGLPGRIITR